MAGPMIPPEILNRKSLFSLLHKIDFEIAEQARARGCPIVGGRCIMPTTRESQGAVLLIWMRHLRSAIAYVAAVKAAGVVFSHHRFVLAAPGILGAGPFYRHRPSARTKSGPHPGTAQRPFRYMAFHRQPMETLFSRALSPEPCLPTSGRTPDPTDPFESSSQGVTITISRYCRKPRISVGSLPASPCHGTMTAWIGEVTKIRSCLTQKIGRCQNRNNPLQGSKPKSTPFFSKGKANRKE